MGGSSLAELFSKLDQGSGEDQVQTVEQLQGQGMGQFYCWSKKAHGDMPMPTMIVENAAWAAEWFIENIRASSPWPQWVEQADGSYGPGTLIPETRVCIDSQGNEFLVGEVDWAEGDDMRHAELWHWFGADEQRGIERVWASMKRGKNSDWF
jgi:hypothetical protein